MIIWNQYTVGNYRIPCPQCNKGAKDKSAGITINPDHSGVVHCFRCSYIEFHKGDRSTVRHTPAFRKSTSPALNKRTTLSDWGWSLWNQCLPIGGVAAEYLKSRRCAPPPKDSHLRWHSSVKHPSGYVGPALVALVTDAITGAAVSLHRTWITETGKAEVNPPRMQLGGHALTNGVIRLWPDDYVTQGLGVAEGIETALSLAHGYEPVWSLIDAGHMAKFPVIPGVDVLVIAQDNDPVGRNAASQCAQRWFAQGRRVMLTSQAANDLNDLLGEVA